MSEFKCVCGKEYKSYSALSTHGNKSRKCINDGKGCPLYHQRKKEKLPVNVSTIKNSKKVVNNNINDDEVSRLSKSLEKTKDLMKLNKTISDTNHSENIKTISEKDKEIEQLKNEINASKFMNNSNNNTTINNTTNNNNNIVINNFSEEALESFFMNFLGTALKTIYNKSNVDDIDRNDNSLITVNDGHLFLPLALYNDPNNKTYKWDKNMNIPFIMKNNKWEQIKLDSLDSSMRNNMYDNLNLIFNDNDNSKTTSQSIAYSLFNDFLKENEKYKITEIHKALIDKNDNKMKFDYQTFIKSGFDRL